MPTPEYQRFLDSMIIGYVQWHDGEGYDLEALAALSPEERAAAETVLLMHLATKADWRDVEALAALGTPGAMTAVKFAAKHGDSEVSNRALEILAREAAVLFFQKEIEARARLARLYGPGHEVGIRFSAVLACHGLWGSYYKAYPLENRCSAASQFSSKCPKTGEIKPYPFALIRR